MIGQVGEEMQDRESRMCMGHRPGYERRACVIVKVTSREVEQEPRGRGEPLFHNIFGGFCWSRCVILIIQNNSIIIQSNPNYYIEMEMIWNAFLCFFTQLHARRTMWLFMFLCERLRWDGYPLNVLYETEGKYKKLWQRVKATWNRNKYSFPNSLGGYRAHLFGHL